ncbi:MAG: 3-dehydroquinate synthase [Bacteroidales bacterium]|jgi:3-dehydroquinate synthase|nr:3-dehydroquinate synthase [Bacteroidales bacterium]
MNIINCKNIVRDLEMQMADMNHSKVFVLTDDGSNKYCTAFLDNVSFDYQKIILKSGDDHKSVEALASVWQFMTDNGADREALLINLGGGMITDLGGFAACTFKRGIYFINIPTTLLAMVDAAVGGKTGINFGGFKNEIGVINHADAVLIDTLFLKTLDEANVLSGYAEMLKHGLISKTRHFSDLLAFDWHTIDYTRLNAMVLDSIKVKEEIVTEDPYEKGIRKALNLGHTIGHAFESLAMKTEAMLHGRAVALGIIVELFLSYQKLGFPTDVMRSVIQEVKDLYAPFVFDCDEYEILYAYAKHDKKNSGDRINFSLLSAKGEVHINQHCTKEEIYAAFDFYRTEMGL